MKEQLERLRQLEETIARIRGILPKATPEMILAFQGKSNVSLNTVRIWAEQGALQVARSTCEIIKVAPPKISIEHAEKLFKALTDGDFEVIEQLRF